VEEARRKKMPWLDIETAPRDGQWFWARNSSGTRRRIYRVFWCEKRECFLHTKLRTRVEPTEWKWNHP